MLFWVRVRVRFRFTLALHQHIERICRHLRLSLVLSSYPFYRKNVNSNESRSYTAGCFVPYCVRVPTGYGMTADLRW